jgi:hypothetical protein
MDSRVPRVDGRVDKQRSIARPGPLVYPRRRVFGRTTLVELCQQLEAIVKKDTLAGPAELLGRIEGEYASVERTQEIT